jgi:surfeit locus 1 family protein
MQIYNYEFKPKLIPSIATLLVLPLLISLGIWQSNKADLKQAKQELFNKRGNSEFIEINTTEINLEQSRFSRVKAKGVYEPDFQILLDNQVYKGQAGYHVITPLRIAGSSMRVLVNRGWIPVGSDRSILPEINTPQAEIEVTGFAQDPSGKYLELSHPSEIPGTWQIVWQNLDIKRYKNLVPFSVQPAVILMDATNSSGGYVREWPKPDFRIEVNRGYAIQWYLMAVALIIIYFVTNIRKISSQEQDNAR